MIYLLQENELRCGDIALRHLLSLVFNDRRYLLIKLGLPDRSSLAEIKAAAWAQGIHLNGYRVLDAATYQKIKRPFIGLSKQGSVWHYLVVILKRRHRFLIVDGSAAPYWISIDEYIKKSSGYVLTVGKTSRRRKRPKPWLPLRFDHRLSNTALYLLSLSMLLIGLYLIDTDVSFTIPIVFLSLAFITMIAQTRTMRLAMNRFDAETKNHLAAIKTREEFSAWHQFKQLFFSKALDWLNHFFVVSLGSALLIINDWFNLIPLGFLGMAAWLINRVMRPKIRDGTERLAGLEAQLFTSRGPNVKTIDEITQLSYRVADKTMFSRLLIVVLVMMTSILFMALRGHVYLNYFLFQGASYYLIVDHWVALVNFREREVIYHQLYYHFFLG